MIDLGKLAKDARSKLGWDALRVVAFSAASWREATERSCGTMPFVCPPYDKESVLELLAPGADLLYFNLHGLPKQGYWYGDGWVTALAAGDFAGVDLSGCIAFTTACWAVGAAPEVERGYSEPGPMVQALLDAGCRAVVAGAGLNYGSPDGRGGVDLLGLWLRRLLGCGWPVGRALDGAKVRVASGLALDAAAVDTLGFMVLGDETARCRSTLGRDRAIEGAGVSPN